MELVWSDRAQQKEEDTVLAVGLTEDAVGMLIAMTNLARAEEVASRCFMVVLQLFSPFSALVTIFRNLLKSLLQLR